MTHLTPDEIRDRIAWLKDRAREGADALHARATHADARQPKLTDAESAAIARARLDATDFQKAKETTT